MDREQSTRQWYSRYYSQSGADRNDLRTNRGVLFQTIAMEASFVRAIGRVDHDGEAAKVLDVGCGGGGDIYQLTRVGYDPCNITGVDILEEHLDRARSLYPQVEFVHCDASSMDFADGSFDLCFSSGMFATLPDDTLSASIASEMVRVCKPGGWLLIVDWWTPKPRDPNYKALTKRRMRELFKVGSDTRVVGIYRGALIPPVGRFLSARLPALYFLTAAVFPFLVGQVAYLLRKSE